MHIRLLVILFFIFLSSSCTNIIRTSEDSSQVRLYFLKHVVDASAIKEFERECTLIGEVIGSEGHWYTYWFMSNPDLTQGAINDLKNNAHAMGANTVIVNKNIDFVTSVTFLGQGYHCANGQPKKDIKSKF